MLRKLVTRPFSRLLQKNAFPSNRSLLRVVSRNFSKKQKHRSFKETFEDINKRVNRLRREYPNEFNIGILFAFLLLSLYAFDNFFQSHADFSDFLADLNGGRVASIKFHSLIDEYEKFYAEVTLNEGSSYTVSTISKQIITNAVEKYTETSGKVVNISEVRRASWHKDLNNVLQFAILLFSVFFLVRMIMRSGKDSDMSGMGMLQNFEKSTAKKFTKEMNIGVKFADVAGMDEAKKEIEEFVDYLKQPQKYKALGAKLPKGALLCGPPGTGKTLLAKACAGEAEVPFFFVSGSEFVEMFVGVGASRVRSLFAEAKSASPAIIFIDEIDAVGKKRSERLGSNTEADSTLNQLLVELDGFGTDQAVVLFAATNRKELLDPALTRPGRIDRMIDVTLPDLDGRRDILKVHLRPLKLESAQAMEHHAKRLASLTPGFSGADLANVCNEAAIQAVRMKHDFVKKEDFETAVERVIGGVEKKRDATETEVRTVAVHESGHGVVAWFLEGADPLLKLTIIPRSKGSLGFAQYLPAENSLQTKQELLDKIVSVLAGRCAEEVFFGKITTGAYDDLQKAYKIAHSIVTKLGMNDRIGYVSLEDNDQGGKIYSDQTNREIDEECKKIIDQCTEKSMEMVRKHRKEIQNISDLLLEKKSIDLRDIISVLGERPFAPKPGFAAYLKESFNT